MYAQLNIVARSRYYCCNGNATMRSLCIAELHVTAKNIKIPGVRQKFFYGEFMTPPAINALMSSRQVSDTFVRF